MTLYTNINEESNRHPPAAKEELARTNFQTNQWLQYNQYKSQLGSRIKLSKSQVEYAAYFKRTVARWSNSNDHWPIDGNLSVTSSSKQDDNDHVEEEEVEGEFTQLKLTRRIPREVKNSEVVVERYITVDLKREVQGAVWQHSALP